LRIWELLHESAKVRGVPISALHGWCAWITFLPASDPPDSFFRRVYRLFRV
jgi:hypothetical protein